jgi:hypothetical protein
MVVNPALRRRVSEAAVPSLDQKFPEIPHLLKNYFLQDLRTGPLLDYGPGPLVDNSNKCNYHAKTADDRLSFLHNEATNGTGYI